MDSSWGRSSTPNTASYSVKLSMHGDRIIVSYTAIVNFGTEKEMIIMKRNYAEESRRVISAVMKNVKATYKKLTDSTLHISESTSTDSVEIIGFEVHNPKRTAYYRCKMIFDIN